MEDQQCSQAPQKQKAAQNSVKNLKLVEAAQFVAGVVRRNVFVFDLQS